MKKFLSIVICLALATCIFSSCASNQLTSSAEEDVASSQSGELDVSAMPVVTYIVPAILTFEDSAVAEVQAEINKLLAERWGIQTKLMFISAGAWNQQSSLMMTSSEVDVLPLYPTPLSTYVANGQIVPLDDYLANSSDAMKAVWPETVLDGARINGVLYGIPVAKGFANKVSLVMSEEIVNAENINVDAIETLDDFEKILYQIKEKYPDVYPVVPQAGDTLTVHWTWDGLGDEKYIGILADQGQSTTVENLFQTDDFINFSTQMHKWYQDGLIMSDVLSNTEYGEQLILGGKAFSTFYDDAVKSPTPGTVHKEIVSPWILSNAYSNITYGININSANKDAAWKLIEAFYTDREISTLLINGIEGKHYIVNDDGTISYPDGKSYTDMDYGGTQQSWLAPNALLSYPFDQYGADYFDKVKESNTQALESKAIGFSFDSSKVSDEYSACITIMEKYYKALLAGVMDPATTLDSVNEELKAAGLDNIIVEKQAQLDEHLREKS